MRTAPLHTIPVSVLLERRPATSPWIDYLWTVASVLPGVPETPDWTVVSRRDEVITFFAGATDVELFRSETPNYRENLARDVPQLWVVLRQSDVPEPPYHLHMVTADPAEGEGATEAGSDLVEAVTMPPAVRAVLEAFVANNPFEREFVKRQRDRADPNALARRRPDKG